MFDELAFQLCQGIKTTISGWHTHTASVGGNGASFCMIVEEDLECRVGAKH